MREAGTTRSTLSLAGCSLLALVTLSFTVIIEYRNWKAEHFLPRTPSEGRGRIPAFWEGPMESDHARAELRGTIIQFGLPLYLLCPLTILWAAWASANSFDRRPVALPVSMTCLAIGILSTILMTSLRLLESLG